MPYLTLSELALALLDRWKLLAISTLSLAILSAGVSLLMEPVYRGEAVVVTATDEAGLGAVGGLASQLGGIAALAGVQFGGSAGRVEALAILRSRLVVERLIKSRGLMPRLYADRWNSTEQQWRRGVKVPTIGDAVYQFRQRILDVREDLKGGVITIRIDWTDRHEAAKWANDIVEIANEIMRERTLAETSAVLSALEAESKAVESIEVRTALMRLIEGQLKSRTMARVRTDFPFKVIDPAVPPDPDKRVRPVRTLIAIAGGVIGAVFAVILVAYRVVRDRTRPAAAD